MKIYIKLFSTLIMASLIIVSCSEPEDDYFPQQNKYGNAQFSYVVKSATGPILKNLKSIIVTIEDINGKILCNKKNLEFKELGDSYITEPLSFKTGTYQLVEFFVLNDSNEIKYAAPLKDSPQAAFVKNPLPLEFIISKDTDVRVDPQVLSVDGHTSEDFGYAAFSFEVVEWPVEICNIKVTGITHNSATIRWTTNVPSVCTLDYGESDTYGTRITAEKSGDGLSHEATITKDLNKVTQYHYKINAETAVHEYQNNNSGDQTFFTSEYNPKLIKMSEYNESNTLEYYWLIDYNSNNDKQKEIRYSPSDEEISYMQYKYSSQSIIDTIHYYYSDGSLDHHQKYEYVSDIIYKISTYYNGTDRIIHTTYEYDSSNKKEKAIVEMQVHPPKTVYFLYFYDEFNKLLKREAYDSTDTIFYYFTYEYNANNLLEKMTRFHGNGDLSMYTLYDYEEQ